MLGYNSINGSCLAWSLLCGINGILSGIQRGRVRRTYEMDSGSGNFFDDCIRGCCCCCCVLAQSEKEIKVREECCRKLGATTSGKNEGYVPPGGMVFSPIRDKNWNGIVWNDWDDLRILIGFCFLFVHSTGRFLFSFFFEMACMDIDGINGRHTLAVRNKNRRYTFSTVVPYSPFPT